MTEFIFLGMGWNVISNLIQVKTRNVVVGLHSSKINFLCLLFRFIQTFKSAIKVASLFLKQPTGSAANCKLKTRCGS